MKRAPLFFLAGLLAGAPLVPAQDMKSGGGETILVGGQVAEVADGKVMIIPLSQAPPQLQHAMEATSLGQ